MFIGGLDIGTSGCKITIYDENGNFIENQYKSYESIHQHGQHEINANDIINAVEYVLSSLKHIPEAIGVTSFGETFVLVDENGEVLANSMLYTDPRAEISVFDIEETKRIAGCSPHSMYSLPKLVWIKNNMPEIYNKTDKVMLIQDFVSYKLTGNACIDYSLAARTMGFDIRKKVWSKEIFEKAGIEISKMSLPVSCGTIVGTSNKFGLKNSKIVAGCHDQVASAIGAGALEAKMAVDGSGSVECITPVFDKLPEDLSVYDKGFAFVPYIEDKYVCYAFSFTGGTALKWFRDNFAKNDSYYDLDQKIGHTPGSVLLVPHFAGAATPYMDNDSKAMFANITLESTKYDLYKAILEGVVFEMKINTDALAEYEIIPESFLVTGGGAKSDVWLQMRADILGVPVTKIDAPEVGTLGTIILTAHALGVGKSLEKTVEIFSKKSETFCPDHSKNFEYQKMYEKYKEMYKIAKVIR